MHTLGNKIFIGGIIGAALLAFVPAAAAWVTVLLVIVGVLVGFLNISLREQHSFLLATVALLLIGSGGLEYLPVVGLYLSPILINISALVAPAALVVAIKTIVDLAQSSK